MKILVLNFEYPPLGGGASPVGRDLAEKYVLHGHLVDVVTMHHESLPLSEYINGVHIFRVKCGRKKVNISTPLEQLKYLIRSRKILNNLFATNIYDYCHCHFLIPTGLLALWVKSKYKLPFLVTIHGSDVPGYNPDRFTFLHLFTKPLLRAIVYSADTIVSPSKYLLGLLKEKITFSEINTPTEIINYGIDIPQKKANSKEKIILSTGRLLKRKGFDTLIKAVSNLDIGYEVHLCGDGPMMSELRELGKLSKTKIVFHGWIDNKSDKYLELLERASIFALVSSHENSSVSIMEAMANGCAIITSDATGCFEMVEDIGLCIKVNDVDALREAIMMLVKDISLVDKYKSLSLDKAIDKYNWERITKQYEELFTSNISKRK